MLEANGAVAGAVVEPCAYLNKRFSSVDSRARMLITKFYNMSGLVIPSHFKAALYKATVVLHELCSATLVVGGRFKFDALGWFFSSSALC